MRYFKIKVSSKTFLFIFLISISFYSCKTYTLTPESFKNQIKNSNLKDAEVNNPLFFNTIHYKANKIDQLKVIDKNESEKIIYISPSIEIRVSTSNNKKHILYFDTVILVNDTLKGSRSRLGKNFDIEIPFKNIRLIELQDGKKNYSYKN